MKISLDISPFKDDSFLSHRVRGVGFYIQHLKASLIKYYSQNEYAFFTRGEKIPQGSDIVHYPYFEPFFLSLPFQLEGKRIVTVHDLTPFVFPKHFPPGLKGKLKWQIQKRLLQKVNAIITDSECSKKDIIKYTDVSEKKIHVAYLAAGEEFGQVKSSKLKVQSLREKYNLPEKFVLYVGDVTWNKNLPRLIEAVKKINVTLVMVGKALVAPQSEVDHSNPWNQDLIQIHKLAKNDKRIIRLGFVPTEDLVFLYNTATVFVMPSLYEGFGLPILEAMSCGCPVVTTKEGSLPEIAGDAAFYVDAYNIDDIANGIGEIFFNADAQKKFSLKGLEQAKKFSWEKTADEVMKVYERTCS